MREKQSVTGYNEMVELRFLGRNSRNHKSCSFTIALAIAYPCYN